MRTVNDEAPRKEKNFSCNELNDATGFLDLSLSFLADVACANDERDLRETALSEDLGVAKGEEVEDWCGITLLLLEVFLSLLGGHKRPELVEVYDRLPKLCLQD
jgi:hypothetical protein